MVPIKAPRIRPSVFIPPSPENPNWRKVKIKVGGIWRNRFTRDFFVTVTSVKNGRVFFTSGYPAPRWVDRMVFLFGFEPSSLLEKMVNERS